LILVYYIEKQLKKGYNNKLPDNLLKYIYLIMKICYLFNKVSYKILRSYNKILID